MTDPAGPKDEPGAPFPPDTDADDAQRSERERDRGISDFVRRAVSAGYEVAVKGKDDVVRVATNEIRNWLDGLELDRELRKALANMVLEVKAEIRFRPTDDGKLSSEIEADMKSKKVPRGP